MHISSTSFQALQLKFFDYMTRHRKMKYIISDNGPLFSLHDLEKFCTRPIFQENLLLKFILVHSLPGSGSGKQNIRHSQKIYIFWKLFTYRIIIAIHNGASWVLPISDFFKLLYSKKGKFSLFFFISKLIEK